MLASLTQVFVPVHLAKNDLLAVITGVLLGKATVGFDESYHEMVVGELHPVAVRVVIFPETIIVDGVAIGLIGADGLALTVTLPIVAGDETQPLVFLTVNE